MATVRYSSTSPYFDTGQTSWYLAPISLRDIPPDSTDVPYVIQQQYTNKPIMLSNDIYGTPAYWWVFMVRNMDVIRDPNSDFIAGKTIMIPTRDRLTKLIG